MATPISDAFVKTVTFVPSADLTAMQVNGETYLPIPFPACDIRIIWRGSSSVTASVRKYASAASAAGLINAPITKETTIMPGVTKASGASHLAFFRSAGFAATDHAVVTFYQLTT